MYITASSSAASSLFRASRANTRLFSHSFSRVLSPSSLPSSSTSYRSLSFASAVRSVRCSVPRWSHGVHWHSPYSRCSQIRAVAPVIEQFQRKIATMGTVYSIPMILDIDFLYKS